MDDEALAFYRRQIVRRCLPPRHRQRSISEHLVVSIAPALVLGFFVAFVFFGIFALAVSLKKAGAFAHEITWLNSKKSAAGEWCCGVGDCFVVAAQHVTLPAPGYRVFQPTDFIPESEVQPSPDGQFWRCKRPDGSRRCFFAPPPGS